MRTMLIVGLVVLNLGLAATAVAMRSAPASSEARLFPCCQDDGRAAYCCGDCCWMPRGCSDCRPN